MIGCLYRPSPNGEGRFGQLMKPKRSDSHTVAFAHGEFSRGLDGINRLRGAEIRCKSTRFPPNCDVLSGILYVRFTSKPVTPGGFLTRAALAQPGVLTDSAPNGGVQWGSGVIAMTKVSRRRSHNQPIPPHKAAFPDMAGREAAKRARREKIAHLVRSQGLRSR